MSQRSFLLFTFLVAILSCKKTNIAAPPDNPDSNFINTAFIPDSVVRKLEGVYELVGGSGDLGIEFVCKVSKSKVSFFSNSGGIYFILKYGLNKVTGAIEFAGFWRYSENDTQGLIDLSLAANEGGSDLLKGIHGPTITISGEFSGPVQARQPIRMKFKKAFSQYAIDHEFMIFGHHGVQTTAEPPFTENSLNAVLHGQDYGINGLEFDVHLTKDSIPICAHDASIDLRVVEKGPLAGEYINYDFDLLEASVRLQDGEKIPSVEQVLNAFIDSTTLKYLWLDIKGDPNIVKYLEPLVVSAYQRAACANRKIEIITDLTTNDVVSQYQSCPSYKVLPTMSELSLDNAIANNCKYWGPRFSLGLLLNDVEKAHALGMKVLSWTLNDPNLITDYLENGKFDGFISDYPAYVVYDFYTLF